MFSLIVGYLLADFVSGFWHWLEDRYFDVRWPLVGKWIAKPNELHHAQPAAFLNQSYWSRNSITLAASAIGVAITLLLSGPAWLLAMFVCVSQANEIHAWAHRRAQSRVIRGLQEFGILQSPRHHAIHHRAPFDCRYCVMSDLVNPVLDAVGFWPAMERLAAVVFRIQTRH